MTEATRVDPQRSVLRSTVAPLLVLLIGLLTTFLAFSLIKRADEDALRADLDADAAQMGLLLQSLANGIETDLTSTVGVALVTGGDENIYRARLDGAGGGDRALVSLRPTPRVLVAIDNDGDDEVARAEFERIAQLPDVAAEFESLAADGEFGLVRLGDADDGTRQLLVAAGASNEVDAMIEVRRFDLGNAGPAIVDLLDGVEGFAVYVTPEPDPDSAVLASTTALPLTGQTASTTTELGGRTLLVEVRGATQGVVAPWLIVAIGSTLSLLLAGLLFVADRRRDHAVASLEAAKSADEARSSLEVELQRTQRMEAVGQLAGGIAHDFNNLLAAITSTVELLTDEVHDERAREDLDEIRHAARRGAALTRRLLSFSRRDVEAVELLDLNAVVDDVHQLLRRSVTADMSLVIDADDQVIPVLGDAGEIEQVLLNLVVNARDSSRGPGHRIEVVTRRDGDTATLIVRDNGAGMSAAVRDRAMEPFFSTKAKTDGTGLGLAIVYGIASRMGGSVSVESTVGEGTTVSVTLPTSDDAPEPPSPEADPGETGGVARDAQIVLLVEDEATVRTATRRLLERAGHTVVDVADGVQAISLVEDGLDPTVLLTDLVLPGSLNGRDVANRVMQMTPTARIIFASGYPSEVISGDELVQQGASFLSKPFTNAALLDAVDGPATTEAAR